MERTPARAGQCTSRARYRAHAVRIESRPGRSGRRGGIVDLVRPAAGARGCFAAPHRNRIRSRPYRRARAVRSEGCLMESHDMDMNHSQDAAIALLREARILPVVTVISAEQAVAIAHALVEGGLVAIELTLRTPAALDAIAAVKQAVPGIAVGAGTVLSAAQISSSRRARRPRSRRRWSNQGCRRYPVRRLRPSCSHCPRSASASANCFPPVRSVASP